MNKKSWVVTIIGAIVFFVLFGVIFSKIPNSMLFLQGIGQIAVRIFIIIVWAFGTALVLMLPWLIGRGIRFVLDRMNKKYHYEEDLNKTAYTAIACATALIYALLNQYLLYALSYTSFFTGIYSLAFSTPDLRENMFSQWGWLITSSLEYVIGFYGPEIKKNL